jgi:predicted chitinase
MASKRLKIQQIEVTSRDNYSKFGLVTTADLEGRPTRVLKRFIDTGIERHWWDKETVFEKVVVACLGKKYVEDLKAMRKRIDAERAQREG